MIKLYGIGLSNNVAKVRYCLNYLGLEYGWEQTNPLSGENWSEEYLSINPTGKVPAIEVDGVKIFESNAIIKYLAGKHNSPLYPQNLEKRAAVDQWLDFVSVHVFHAMSRVLFNRAFAPMMGEKVDEESILVGLKFIDKYLPVLDKQLEKNKYLAGDELTLADINLLAVLDTFPLMQVSLDAYNNVTKWQKQLQAQEWYRKCFDGSIYAQFVQNAMQQMAQAK